MLAFVVLERLGADAVFTKPIDYHALAAVLEKLRGICGSAAAARCTRRQRSFGLGAISCDS